MNIDGSSCDVFKSWTVIWIGFVSLSSQWCLEPHLRHGDFCVICDVSLEFLKEVFCVDSP